MLALATKACYEELDENEVQIVADFLFGVDAWTNLELFVFNYTVGQVSFNLIRSIWIDFFKNVTYFEDNREYRIRIGRTTGATCLVMLERERANDAWLTRKPFYNSQMNLPVVYSNLRKLSSTMFGQKIRKHFMK